jgi:hypothetical protein
VVRSFVRGPRRDETHEATLKHDLVSVRRHGLQRYAREDPPPRRQDESTTQTSRPCLAKTSVPGSNPGGASNPLSSG